MKKAEGYVIRKLEEEYVLIPCGERARRDERDNLLK